MKIAIWKTPEGIAADCNVSMLCRIRFYRFNMSHFLIDNTQVVPTVQTAKNILYSYDCFGIDVAVDSNSYTEYALFNVK